MGKLQDQHPLSNNKPREFETVQPSFFLRFNGERFLRRQDPHRVQQSSEVPLHLKPTGKYETID